MRLDVFRKDSGDRLSMQEFPVRTSVWVNWESSADATNHICQVRGCFSVSEQNATSGCINNVWWMKLASRHGHRIKIRIWRDTLQVTNQRLKILWQRLCSIHLLTPSVSFWTIRSIKSWKMAYRLSKKRRVLNWNRLTELPAIRALRDKGNWNSQSHPGPTNSRSRSSLRKAKVFMPR